MTAPPSTEERLRAYCAVLDEETATLLATRAVSHAVRPATPRVTATPSRLRMGIVAAAAAVALVTTLVVVSRTETSHRVGGTSPIESVLDPTTTPAVSLPPASETVSQPTGSSGSTTPPSSTTASAVDPGGTWTMLPDSPLSARDDASVVWTGTEYLVWGGHNGLLALSDGAAYDPAAGTWRAITPNEWAHPGAISAWTGTKMVVLAKRGGAMYDVSGDTWEDLPTLDGSDPRQPAFTNAVWTGSTIAGIGPVLGADGQSRLGLVTIAPGESAWHVHTVPDIVFDQDLTQIVPTPGGFVVWEADRSRQVAWRYDAATDSWEQLLELTLPEDMQLDNSAAVWLDDHLAIVVTETAADESADSALYELTGGTWKGRSGLPFVVDGTDGAIAVGSRIVLLSTNIDEPVAVDPAAFGWAALTGYPLDATAARSIASDGDRLFVWGGERPETVDADGNADAARISAAGALWTPGAPGSISGTVIDGSAGTLVFPNTRVDVGCIDETGPVLRNPHEWYAYDAAGAILLSGVDTNDTTTHVSLDTAAAALLPGYTSSTAADQAETDGGCAIYHATVFRFEDTSMVKVSVWRVIQPANTIGLPQYARFEWSGDDLLVSESDEIGERSVVKVLDDGTSIKVQASGVGAMDYSGYPTTAAPRPGADPPAPAAQTVAQLADIADAVAAALIAER